jgi:hypothetical protein
MANTTVTNLPVATTLSGSEVLLGVQSGSSVQITTSQVAALASTGPSVSSITFGSTGLTPSTASTGAVTVAGTLATGNGGTGLTTFTAANNAIYSTSSSALTAGTLPVAAGGTGTTTPSLVAGTNISISGTWPNQTINSTVAVGLTIGTTPTTGGAAGQIMFDTGSVIQESSSLIWDNTNKALTVNGTAVVSANSSSDALRITQVGSGNSILVEDSANPDTSPFVVNNNGQVLVGSQTAPFGSTNIGIFNNAADTAPAYQDYFKNRAGATVVSGDGVGQNRFWGYDGTTYLNTAAISSSIDGTVATGDAPGRLTFFTRPTGGSGVLERMRIDNLGAVGVGISALTGYRFRVGGSATGATTMRGISSSLSVQADVTAEYRSIESVPNLIATVALTNLSHFYANEGSYIAGYTLTNSYGFHASSGLIGGTNNYGFYGNIAAAANRWNFFASGTANNAFAGNVRIGSTVAPTVALDVTGAVLISTTLGVTTSITLASDAILTRRGSANLRFGAADAASPVAQTLSVQSVVAGTTDTAGTDLTITGSQSTGTGTAGNIVFQTASSAASTATTQNALATVMTIGPNTLTGSQAINLLSLAQTWNTSGTPTALKLNITDTASNASSLLMDLQLGGVTYAGVAKTGEVYSRQNITGAGGLQVLTNGSFGFNSNSRGFIVTSFSNYNVVNLASGWTIGWGSGSTVNGTYDTAITRRGAANLRFGAADAAAPVAQTLSVQSVVAGTTDTAGANLTITGSQGTGTGAGGSIIFQVATAGSTGSTQNALATALTINSDKTITAASYFTAFSFQATDSIFLSGNKFYVRGSTGVVASSDQSFGFSSGTGNANTGSDARITRRGAANLQLGGADAAAPVAQTLSVQSVVAGTSNVSGADWTFTGSVGTGTGYGGNFIWQTAAATTTGTTQNTLSEKFRIDQSGAQFYYTVANAVNATATLTIAQIQGRIITSTTAATVTMTMPTGTVLDTVGTGLSSTALPTGATIDFTIKNTGGTNAITLAVATGVTNGGASGDLTIAANATATYRLQKTGSATFVLYKM